MQIKETDILDGCRIPYDIYSWIQHSDKDGDSNLDTAVFRLDNPKLVNTLQLYKIFDECKINVDFFDTILNTPAKKSLLVRV